LITAAVKNSRDQEALVVPVVDDIALDNDRANTFAELGPAATQARLFDEPDPNRQIKDSELEAFQVGSHTSPIPENTSNNLLFQLHKFTCEV